MCETCGCTVTPGNVHLVREDGALAETADGEATVEVLSRLLVANDHEAEHNRSHFDDQGVLAINLMSAPGSGKTRLLETTIDALRADPELKALRIAVIEGDLETENDAERIRAHGVDAVQITTGQACHLDAHMVHQALHELDLGAIDLLFIENVGNLVCPASFDLGHHLNVTLLSVTEGDDKPAKYPVMFRTADLVLLTKADYLAFLDDFDPEAAAGHVRNLANPAPVLTVSSQKPDGLAPWISWLRETWQSHRDGARHRPRMQPDGAVLHDGTRG